MEKVINLRTVKKQNARVKSRVGADSATAGAGIKRAERDRLEQLNARAKRTLDAHRREEDV